MIATVIVSFVIGMCLLAVPYFFKLIVDQLSSLVTVHNPQLVAQKIIQILVVLGAVQIVLLFARYYKEYLEDNLRLDSFFDLRKMMMAHSLELSLDYYETNQAGSISDKITSGVYDFGLWLDEFIQSSLIQIFTVALAIIIIWLRSPLAGMVATAAALLKIILLVKKIHHVGGYRREGRRRYVAAQGVMVESIANMATIRSITTKKAVYERFVKTYNHIREIRFVQIVVERRYNAAISLIDAVGTVLVVGVIAFGAAKGSYSIGDVLLVSIYFTNAMNALSPLARFFDTTAEADVSAAGIVELLEAQVTVRDVAGAVDLPMLSSVEFKDVMFHYPGHKAKVLDAISFRVEGNKTVALVGPSGTGKTTITKLLMRFYEPTSGQILINDQDITTFTQESLREHMGVVMQDVALFNASFEENLRMAHEGATRQDLDEVVDNAHLREFLDGLPDGYATQVGERGIKLSGGQKQRVAIARAMLRDPQMIILDEATSALDSQSEQEVQKGLTKLMQGRMAVIIAHRLSTVRHAEEIIVIKRGKIAERGDHDQLIAKDGLYAKLYNMQGKL